MATGSDQPPSYGESSTHQGLKALRDVPLDKKLRYIEIGCLVPGAALLVIGISTL